MHGLAEHGLCLATIYGTHAPTENAGVKETSQRPKNIRSSGYPPQHSMTFEFHTPSCDALLLERVLTFVAADLSEPYSVFTFRYFLERYSHICILVYDTSMMRPDNKDPTDSVQCVKRIQQDSCSPPFLRPSHARLRNEPPFQPRVKDLAADGRLIAVVVSQLNERSELQNTSSYFTAAPTHGYIGMIAVDPRYRRQGLGRLLVKTAVGLIALQGANEVVLETEVTNVDALRLYEREGFFRVGRKTRYYLNGGDAFVLKKPISTSSTKCANIRGDPAVPAS